MALRQYRRLSYSEVLMRRFPMLLPSVLAAALILAPDAHAAASDRLASIAASKVLRVCIWPDYYGITYRNPKTQQLSGIDIDLAAELGKDLGIAVEFIDSSFATLIDDVRRDRCDIAMFGIGITPARIAKLRFSAPYLASDIYAISTRHNHRIKQWSNIDQRGTIVAVSKGTLHESVMKNKLKNAQLLVLDTPFAREQEVQSGRADAFMTDYPYSRRFLANNEWARLLAPPGAYHVTPYAYAIQYGDDAWHTRIERFVATIKRDGRLNAAAKRHQLDPIVVF